VEHDELVAEFGALLTPRALSADLAEGSVTVRLPRGVLAAPLVAIPDCHLSDGSDGDEFFDDDPANVARLEAVLRASSAFLEKHPEACVIQLGDWFDLWRASSGAIQSAPLYQTILELDAAIGLRHIVGNHDAAFVNEVPLLRAQQPSAFRLGEFLMPSVFAIHGHQGHIASPDHEAFDQIVVGAATAVARFVPGVRTFEEFIDSDVDLETALKALVHDALGTSHGDPPPAVRTRDTRSGAPDPSAPFVVRENVDVLAAIVSNVATLAHTPMPKVIVVGHSHNPCVAWSSVGESPVVVVDAGACVFGRFNLLLGAGDRVTVFDVRG
jgi:hypothetical protein